MGSWAPDYFVAGAGAAGVPGVGDSAGAAGAGALAGTIDAGREESFASPNDVIMKRIAATVVILPRMVGVPMEPNTAWLPPPPNAEPMSAPLPAWSSTIPMMAKHTSVWRTTRAIYTSGSFCGRRRESLAVPTPRQCTTVRHGLVAQ